MGACFQSALSITGLAVSLTWLDMNTLDRVFHSAVTFATHRCQKNTRWWKKNWGRWFRQISILRWHDAMARWVSVTNPPNAHLHYTGREGRGRRTWAAVGGTRCPLGSEGLMESTTWTWRVRRRNISLNFLEPTSHSRGKREINAQVDVQNRPFRGYIADPVFFSYLPGEYNDFTRQLIFWCQETDWIKVLTEQLYTFVYILIVFICIDVHKSTYLSFKLWQWFNTDPALLSAWGAEWVSSGSPLERTPLAPW